MSIGIVSLKEGHDESHNDDMKLETKFWNVLDNVTIRLTQKYWHKGCFNWRGKLLTFLWTLGGMKKAWHHWLDEAEHNMTMENPFFERLKGVTWLIKVDWLRDKLIYPVDWMKCRQVPCSKVTTNYHFICKMNWFPSLNFPIMIDDCLFSFLRVQRG